MAAAARRNNPSAYNSEVLADSPLLYYKLDETGGSTANDSSGNGRHASLNGTFSLNQAGLGNAPRACNFNNGYLNFTNDGVMITSGMAFNTLTFEFWAKVNGVAVNVSNRAMSCMSMHRSDASRYGAGHYYNGVTSPQVLNMDVKDNAAQYNLATPADWDFGDIDHWVMVVARATGNVSRIYRNSSLVAGPFTLTNNGQWDYNSGAISFRVGKSNDTFWSTPNITVCRVALYNGELSATRVLAHYNAGN